MLTEIHIKNFAVIEELSLSLGSGLTVLTGETGAGKSIVVTAINLLLGDRAASDLIRTGCDEAVVEAILEIPSRGPAADTLRESGYEAEDGQLLVRRVISKTGRNKVFVGGRLATLQVLTGLMEPLVSVSGQHEHQTLLRPKTQLDLLDSYGGLWDLRAEVGELVREYRDVESRLHHQATDGADRARRMQLLGFEIEELEAAGLIIGEEDELVAERDLLANAEKIHQLARRGADLLYDGSGAAVEALKEARGLAEQLAEFDGKLSEVAKQLESAYYQVEDAGLGLRDYADSVVFDPARLEQVGDRLAKLRRFSGKYGGSVESALAHLEAARAELDDLSKSESDLSRLEDQARQAHQAALGKAEELSAKRAAEAGRLAEAMQSRLESLAMSGTKVQIALERHGSPDEQGRCHISQTGLESAEILISPNVGEEVRPLSKIASGGELSRVLLALRTLTAGDGDQETIIFDEVDAGIGGAVAEVVGKNLLELSGRLQVMCITHQPQIAVFGDDHFSVKKEVAGARTKTTVDHLTENSRLREVARMLSGAEVTEHSQAHARELLERALGTRF